MGGIIIIISVLTIYGLFSLINARFSITVFVILFVMIGYGIIGFMDDYSKIKNGIQKGIQQT